MLFRSYSGATPANETIDGGAGADLVDAGTGDDTVIFDMRDTSLGGGDGNDTLRIGGTGTVLDLSEAGRPTAGALRPTITSMETIDINNAQADVIVLSPASLLAMGNANNTLTLDTNNTDKVFLDGAWAGPVTSGGYDVYTINYTANNVTTPLTVKVTSGVTVGTVRYRVGRGLRHLGGYLDV